MKCLIESEYKLSKLDSESINIFKLFCQLWLFLSMLMQHFHLLQLNLIHPFG